MNSNQWQMNSNWTPTNDNWIPNELQLNHNWVPTELQLSSNWTPTKPQLSSNWATTELQLSHNWVPTKLQLSSNWTPTELQNELQLSFNWTPSELQMNSNWAPKWTPTYSNWTPLQPRWKINSFLSEITVCWRCTEKITIQIERAFSVILRASPATHRSFQPLPRHPTVATENLRFNTPLATANARWRLPSHTIVDCIADSSSVLTVCWQTFINRGRDRGCLLIEVVRLL